LAIDIGGSGAKSAIFDDYQMVGKVMRTKAPNVDDALFGKWVADEFGNAFDAVALGIPGFIDVPREMVVYAFHPTWINSRPGDSVRAATGISNVILMNDAEAHAYSSRHCPTPVLQFALGSGFGIAVLDADYRFVRPQHGSFDVGRFKVGCDLSKSEVWYALSGKGLAELETRDSGRASESYARLLAEFAVGMIVMFQPKTLAFSGGIVANRSEIVPHVAAMGQHGLPKWYLRVFGPPSFILCERPESAGLRGLAAAAVDRCRGG
jgi:ROK family